MARQVLTVPSRTTTAATAARITGPYIEWSPVFAGAIVASAVSILLLSFGASVGLSMTSPWPNSGTSIWTTVIAVAWWTVMVQIGGFFLGGYIAGRMRSSFGSALRLEGQFRDGLHGLLVWSVGILLGAFVLAWAGSGILKNSTQAAATVSAGAASGVGAASSGTNALGTSPVDYAVDYLLRQGPSAGATQLGNAGTTGQGDSTALRAEASRIYTASIKNGEFTARDRDYLTQVVATRTGLSQTDAQQRVDQSIEEAKDLEIKARVAADKARKTTLVAGFLSAASMLLGLAAACAGAALGGDQRDRGRPAHIFGRNIWWRD